jgi:hypothetical protein
MLWLVVRRKLHTQDKLRSWGITNHNSMDMMCCLLCFSNLESHDHLFFACSYTNTVWKLVCTKISRMDAPSTWIDVLGWMSSFASSNTTKLCIAAMVYHLWRERNTRYHDRGAKKPHVLFDSIVEDVRYRLIGLKFKRTNNIIALLDSWGIQGSMTFDDGG